MSTESDPERDKDASVDVGVRSDPPLGPVPDGIPDSLREREQWVAWTVGCRQCYARHPYGTEICTDCSTDGDEAKPTKTPLDPATDRNASPTDPSTWTSFDEALAHYRDHDRVHGVGYIFIEDDPFCGVDLDDCVDPETGDVDDWALAIVERLTPGYVAYSGSCTGLHLIVEATLPDGGNRQGSIEMYDTARYFALTGVTLG